MKPITSARQINAPLSVVFRTVADIRNFSRAVPHIVKVEFLTEQQSGVGTRFRETRLMGNKEQQTELEVTEFADNDRIRLVSDAGGTIWDTVFSVKSADNGVLLEMNMDIRPYRRMAKLLIPLFRGPIVKGVNHDMDCVRQYCEHDESENAHDGND
ncbi:MAG: SRPBCC family protein [Planctomycetaceae bacterium]|nr:SRPBCC family protein [Planctomycetaceae bacterium]